MTARSVVGFPNEVWLKILSWADPQSVCRFSRACTWAKALADSNIQSLPRPFFEVSVQKDLECKFWFTIPEAKRVTRSCDIRSLTSQTRYCKLRVKYYKSEETEWLGDFTASLMLCPHDMLTVLYLSEKCSFYFWNGLQSQRDTELVSLLCHVDLFTSSPFFSSPSCPISKIFELKYTDVALESSVEVSASELVSFLKELRMQSPTSCKIGLASRIVPAELPFDAFLERLLQLSLEGGLLKLYEFVAERTPRGIQITSLKTGARYRIFEFVYDDIEPVICVGVTNWSYCRNWYRLAMRIRAYSFDS